MKHISVMTGLAVVTVGWSLLEEACKPAAKPFKTDSTQPAPGATKTNPKDGLTYV